MLAVVIILIVIITTSLGHFHGSEIVFMLTETHQDRMLVLEALANLITMAFAYFKHGEIFRITGPLKGPG